ncbi:hypothetical protein Maes01_01419 [Microbulbifer aestuariivivens]|uniref:TonB-dependent receptor n=1 Tax=Microbulbifer aestuariivivens TaxID=1908308 RepID=A0ABP9WRL0_9GAMM
MSNHRSLRHNLARSALALAIGAATLASPAVFADEITGTIRGAVVGVENAKTIKLTDTARGITKEIGVEADGKFRFGSLTPGKYQLQVFNETGVVDTQTVSVSLGGTASIVLGAGAALEEVVVNGERISQVDVGVAESGLVMSSEELLEIPVARDLTSVTLLAPSVSKGDRTFGNNASFAGASVSENTSYINGLNTTNFRTGLGFATVPFEFYDNIQVKTGGYSAKFGRSTGGVMNATTKSGSNEFKFGSNVYFDKDLETAPNTFSADNDQDVFEETNTDIYASGALIQDRLFYYALYSRESMDSEAYDMTSGRGYKTKRDTDFWGVKLDGYITDNHRVEFTAFSDERETIEGIYEYDSGTEQVGDYEGNVYYQRGGLNWIATYVGDLSDSMTLSVSYGESEQDRSTVPDNADAPVVWAYDAATGTWSVEGDWVDTNVSEGEDQRKMVRVDFTWELDDHLLEVGLDREKNSSSEHTVFSGGDYWELYPDFGYVMQGIATNIGNFETISNAFYIQDTWDVTDNLSVQMGLRNETFENMNKAGDAFIEVDNQWAPRLGAVWDPTGSGNQKVYANMGMYYLPIPSNTNIRMAGDELFIYDYQEWDGVCQNEDGTPCNLGDSFAEYVYANGELNDTRSLVDSNIEPMYQSEFILGYEYVLESGIQLGVKGMYRNLETSIEDVAIDAAVIDYYNNSGTWDASKVGGATVEELFGGFHQYVLTNPGNDMRVYIPEMEEYVELSADQLGYPEAKRQYGAVELTFNRPFDGKWSMNASYTWAHNWGNNEGGVRSDNGQSDSGLTTNFDQPGLLDGAYGDLPNDRRHTVKAFGSYQFDIGLLVGANFMWQTGRPQNCFGVHPDDDFAFEYGAESFYCGGEFGPRGSYGRTENYWNLDLKAQYPIQFAGNQKVLLSVDVFNLLNNDTVVETYEVGEDDRGEQANPNFGSPVYYQDPRSIRLGIRYDFN